MTEHFHRPNVAAEATQNDPQPLISNQQNKRPQDSTPKHKHKHKHNKLITNKIQNNKRKEKRLTTTRFGELW